MTRRIVFPIGLRIMGAVGILTVVSFLLCAMALVTLTQRALRADLERKVARAGTLLAIASGDLAQSDTARGREQFTRLADTLLQDPEIRAVAIRDRQKHPIIQRSRGDDGARRSGLFSLRTPITGSDGPVGWIYAWYSPGFAFEEFWSMAGNLTVVLICALLAAFILTFLLINERMLARPFREFLAAVAEVEEAGAFHRLPEGRRDEWGALGERLNGFLDRLAEVRQQSQILVQTGRLLGMPAATKRAIEELLPELLLRHDLSSCVIFVPEQTDRLRIAYGSGISSEFSRSFSLKTGEGVVGICQVSLSPRLIPDATVQAQDPFLGELVRRQQIRSAALFPLVIDGQALGVAVYSSRVPEHFTAAKEGASSLVTTLSNFTQSLALSVKNGQKMGALIDKAQQLEEENSTVTQELLQIQGRLVRKVRELQTVYELALATAASTNVEEIVRVILQGVKELAEVQSAAFFFYDAADDRLMPLTPAFDRSDADTATWGCALEQSAVLREVIHEGQPKIYNYVDAAAQLPPSWKTIGIRSMLLLPLRQGGAIKGLFCAANKLSGIFTEDDLRLLSLLTGRVSDVVHRASLDAQLRQRVADLSVLQDIATQLPSPPILAETLGLVGKISREALGRPAICFFYVYHPESEVLAMMGGDWDESLPVKSEALTIGASENLPLAEAFQSGRMLSYRAPAVGNWAEDVMIQALGIEELIYVPLRVQQGAIGVMAVGCGAGKPLSPESRRLAGIIAEQTSVIIERSRLYERLRSANSKLEQINTLKNEFISMVSHELRTPLTTIKGFVSIVLEQEIGTLNKQQQHFLQTSDRAIDRLTLLVSDLLDISRIEAGQIKMQLHPVSMKELIEKVITNFDPQFHAQNLYLKGEYALRLPPVLADPHRLMQVFDNLLANALKFTATGGVVIRASDKGDFVMVSIEDTGVGIESGEREKIFDKFYQIKIGNGWPSKGTGLGLAIVKSIVESHRGKVWVESELGRGSAFRFLIPRARAEALPSIS